MNTDDSPRESKNQPRFRDVASSAWFLPITVVQAHLVHRMDVWRGQRPMCAGEPGAEQRAQGAHGEPRMLRVQGGRTGVGRQLTAFPRDSLAVAIHRLTSSR